MKARDSAVQRIGAPLQHTFVLEPIDDAADRGVRQADGVTQLLEAGALMPHHHLHDRHLRWRQFTARDRALQRNAERATDRSEIASDLLSRLWARLLPPWIGHHAGMALQKRPGISAFTRRR